MERSEMADKPKKWDDKLDVNIQFSEESKTIQLPIVNGMRMPLQKAAELICRKAVEEDEVIRVREHIVAYPQDAAVAFVKALKSIYGWYTAEGTQSFWGKNPPEFMSVKTGPRDEDVISCPMGDFNVPTLDSTIGTMINKGQFVIYAQVPRKNQHVVLELANETRRIVREDSIFQGKPIRLMVDDDGDLLTEEDPVFIDVSGVESDVLLFDDDIQAQINQSVLVPIRHTARCRELHIPLKRGILVHGKYGTGKSLILRRISYECQQNGWNYVALNKVVGLRAVLEWVHRYMPKRPTVVECEDFDRITEVRNDGMNELALTLDGTISKDAEIMVVATTNHPEKIHEVVTREGRLDVKIEIRPPGPKTVERLLRHYGGSLISPTASLSNAGLALAGRIPARIRAVVEEAKLGMIERGADSLTDGDLVVAAQVLQDNELVRPVAEMSVEETLADSLRKVVGNQTTPHLMSLERALERIEDHLSS